MISIKIILVFFCKMNDTVKHKQDYITAFIEGYICAIIGGKQSLRVVLRTLIKIYTFAPNFKFGTK